MAEDAQSVEGNEEEMAEMSVWDASVDSLKFPKLVHLREILSDKAKSDPHYHFHNLYGHLLREDVLECAYLKVRANLGGPGVDGMTFEEIEHTVGWDAYLKGLRDELRAKTYRPSPVKRRYVKKANGKMRPLGIPTIKDRTVQAALLLVLEPIFEADFHDCSYGFRSGRCAQQAVERIQEDVKAGSRQVYDADLSSYFDTIPHDKLILALRTRVVDRSVLLLIQRFLTVCVREPDGRMVKPKGRGTPQGGVISPLLSNVYLHFFEVMVMREAKVAEQPVTIVRYADDFVLLAPYFREGFLAKVEGFLEGRMGLTINRDKTKVLDMRRRDSVLTFLGYEFRNVWDIHFHTNRRYLAVWPSKKSVKGVCAKVKQWTQSRMGRLPIPEIIKRVNRVLSGWAAYFRVGHPYRAFGKVNWYTIRRLWKFLHRRSQRGFRWDKAKGTFTDALVSLGLRLITSP